MEQVPDQAPPATEVTTPAQDPAPAADPAQVPPAHGLARVQVAGVVAAAVAGAAIVVTLLVPKPAAVPLATTTSSVVPASRAATSSAGAVVDGSARPGWHVASEWVGAHKRSLAYELEAGNKVRVWMRQVRPVLVVRCLSREIDAFVVTGSAASLEPGHDDHTVQVAFDDHADTPERWLDSSEHDALFAPDGEAFVGRLSRARTLHLRFTPHNAPAADVSFDLGGAGDVAERLARTCG
jgi:hypothetical protein